MNRAENFWNASASNYDRTEARFEYIHRKSRESASRHLRPGDVVLDYGCGTGTATCEFAHLVNEVHGIDISSEMVEAAQGKADAQGIENVSFARSDIFDDQRQESSYDVVLAFNVLHTVPEPERVVGRIAELLKPGGLLVSVTPCFRDRASLFGHLQILIVRALCVTGAIPIPIRSVGGSDLETLVVESGGLRVVDAESIYKGTSSQFLVAQKAPRA